MPNYEYYCRTCKKSFSAHMSVREHDERTPECPEHHKAPEVEKRLATTVYVVTTKKS
jgi:putative FmdB family regulatory protein